MTDEGCSAMPQVIVSDCFYGDESKEFSYFRIPRLLISHARFKNISVEAKLLYGLQLDRMGTNCKCKLDTHMNKKCSAQAGLDCHTASTAGAVKDAVGKA